MGAPTTKQHTQTPPKKSVAPTAPVGLWDRFPKARTVHQMMETMDRIMEDPLEYSNGWSSTVPSEDKASVTWVCCSKKL
ncbi:hypothetical protein CsatA_008076 [Cannabis sativa]